MVIPMRRFVRIALWSSLVVAVLAGAALVWIESELRPGPLAKRLPGLLESAGLKGTVSAAEASIDGSFKTGAVDLTLTDGTRLKASSMKGDLAVLSALAGKIALESLEIKGVEIDLSGRKSPGKDAPEAPDSAAQKKLPAFALGPYSASGRVTLQDGSVVRFSIQGDGVDSAGDADLRAGLAWPGFEVGKGRTEPRGEVVLTGSFERPLGGQGLSPAEIARDIRRLSLRATAKDASPIAAGSMELVCEARPEAGGLSLTGGVKDAGSREALKFSGKMDGDGRLRMEAALDVDPSKFGILSSSLPDCRLRGSAKAAQGDAGWSFETDLRASWADLSRVSQLLPKDAKSEWSVRLAARTDSQGMTVERLEARGHGIAITAPAPLLWKSGPLPEDSSGAALTVAADDADLVALNPFLAATGAVITSGRWSGEAALSFVKGRPEVTGGRTHAFREVAVSVDGKPLFKDLNASFPLRTEGGTITLAPFEAGFSGGRIVGGSLTFRPGEGGSWKAAADADLDLAALATMPGWQDLPAEKMKGLRAAVKADAARDAGGLPTVSRMEAGISRNGSALLSLRLRQPYAVGGPKPAGTLLEVSAHTLPLESVAALVPGLGLTGDMQRAELAVGFKNEGLFIRTEGAPLSLIGTSVSWEGRKWAERCDLNATLDIVIGDKASTIGLGKAELKNRGRTLAAGDIVIGLGEAPTTLSLVGALGALAEQPFAAPLSVATAGSYSARASRNADGRMSASLELADVVLRESPVRVSSASVEAGYVPGPQGFEARGGFRLVALGRSEGKFTLKQTKSGQSTDWRAEIDVPSVTVDDFMALVPKPTEPAATEAVQPKPDRAPFWAGHTGGAEIRVGSVTAMGVRAESIEATLAADGASLLLSRLVGKLSGGSFNGKGALGFRPLTSGGPYVLGADLSAQQLDLGALLAGFPSTKDMLEGKGDAKLRVTATAGTAGELAGRAVVEAEAVSKGGRLRAFGDGKGKAAGITQGAGEIADVIGAVAILGGALGKNEKLLKGGAALSAAAKLQRSVSDFRYDLVEIRAERLASGTLKLTKLEARNEELTLTASGGISMNPALALADRPLAIDAQLRGRGEFAEYFQILGFAEAAPSPDGLTLGPGVKVTGSLNDIRNDLTERIQAAVSRNRSAPAQPQRAPQAAPGGEAAPGRRPNPLGDLLKELGR